MIVKKIYHNLDDIQTSTHLKVSMPCMENLIFWFFDESESIRNCQTLLKGGVDTTLSFRDLSQKGYNYLLVFCLLMPTRTVTGQYDLTLASLQEYDYQPWEDISHALTRDT
jgi:hypothetical protein